MNALDLIKSRRSIGVVKPEMPPKEWIEQMLEAATWAPNHHQTEPWRFFVLTGTARNRLGEAMEEITKEGMPDPHSEESRKQLEKLRKNPLRAPVVIAVAASPSTSPKVVEVEEIEAVACAVQNMMLVAHQLGLGSVWRTGGITYHPKLKDFFGLGERDLLLGFVYVGFPDMTAKPKSRTPYSEKTVWMES